MKIEELEEKIIAWGCERGIIGPDGANDPFKQMEKTLEEVGELQYALDSWPHKISEFDETEIEVAATIRRDMIRDAIGDIIVTLIMQAQIHGMSLQECIESAWAEIKDRKGKMVDGMFVKEYL